MGVPAYQKVSTRHLSETSTDGYSSGDSQHPLIVPSKELLSSPPPSPDLLPLPFVWKEQRARNLRVFRLLLHISCWVLVGGFLLWALTALFEANGPFKASVSYLQKVEGNDTLIHNDTLPAYALPVVVTDPQGKERWTVSIPPYEEFPLRPSVYADLCGESQSLARHLDMIKKGYVSHLSYYQIDDRFMEVTEAEQNFFLPPSISAQHASVVPSSGDIVSNYTGNRDPKIGVCLHSLTYVLESTDAGFGSALMGLWLAYGLAIKEGRAFFIDDRKWVYGTYTQYFAAPPSPSCAPPPESQRLPCPHYAAHLLVTAATTHWTFGHAFNEEFEDPRGMEVERQKPIFGLMRAGYEALFHLASSDAEDVKERTSEIFEAVRPGLSVGIQVRRGDKKPYEQKYAQIGEYVPSARYVDAANDELLRSLNPDNDTEFGFALNNSRMVLATDDPAVYDEWEFRGQERAQMRVVLATEAYDTVNVTAYPDWGGEKVHQPWDGGFYQDKFWAMSPSGRDGEDSAGWSWGPDPAAHARQLMAKAYVLDLAVLSRMDRVVCTVSSTGCRLLAVMMGWDSAIEGGRWINVDGDWDWKGIVW